MEAAENAVKHGRREIVRAYRWRLEERESACRDRAKPIEERTANVLGGVVCPSWLLNSRLGPTKLFCVGLSYVNIEKNE